MSFGRKNLDSVLGQLSVWGAILVAFSVLSVDVWGGIDKVRQVEERPQPVFDLADLDHDARFRFQMFSIDMGGMGLDRAEIEDYHFGVVRPEAEAEIDARIDAVQSLQAGQPPQVSKLAVALKGKNKAVASFEVTDPDGDLGKSGGVSILLFDRDIKGVASARNGNFLLFGDKSIFSKPLDFTGKSTATFPFTLKGFKQLPNASIWVSGIRDSAGNLSLAPASAGIAGRTGVGPAPQIMNANGMIFNGDDTVGVNLDGVDDDADTAGMTLAFLDSTRKIVFALGIVGEQGFRNFAPFPLELVRSPVRGKTSFNINFSISGINAEVKPGTVQSVAISLLDSNGNRSASRIVQLATGPATIGN